MEPLSNTLDKILNFGLGAFTLGTILSAVLAFVVSLVLIRVVTTVLHRAVLKARRLDTTLARFLESAVRVVLWVLAAIIIADLLGIPTTSLIAVVSVAGLALSLSIQNIISNLFSGITLLVTKPFTVGDFVDVAGKTGTVDRVGLFYTVLRTPDSLRINIPNGDVTAASVTNFSTEPNRRVDLVFNAAYSASTESVKAAILEAAKADARILTDPAPFVSIQKYGESSIEYVARVWCIGADYWDVYFSMNERVREAFARNGVEMTYNHLNVHLDK